MRFVWTLAIACVIAATGVRPQLEARQDASEQQLERGTPAALQHLTARPSQLPLLATRSHAGSIPELRATPPAILPTANVSLTPPRIRALAIAWSLHASHSHFVPAHSARGPPLVG